MRVTSKDCSGCYEYRIIAAMTRDEARDLAEQIRMGAGKVRDRLLARLEDCVKK